jgi:hypothetical protein
VLKGHKVVEVQQEPKEVLVLKVLREDLVDQDQQGHKDQQDLTVLLDHMDIQVQQDHKEPKGRQDHKDQLDQLDHQILKLVIVLVLTGDLLPLMHVITVTVL